MAFGVVVNSRTSPPGRGAQPDTSTVFLCCQSTAGSTTSVTEVHSIQDYEASYANRAAGGVNTPTWDWLDVFFREGGTKAVVARYATNYQDALALLADDRLGPGQLVVIGAGHSGSSAEFTDMQTHCAAYNRVAIRDGVVGDTVTTLVTIGGHAPASDDLGATFAPWVTVPPPAGVIGGSARNVPPSAVVCGLISRVDRAGNPNRAAGGRDFPLQYATGFAIDVGDVDRQTLFNAGVNTFKNVYGVLENYGFQTNITDTNNPFWQFNVSRLRMFLKARSKIIGENYYMKPIDGRGLIAGALKGDLQAMLKAVYDVDGLYSPDGTAQSAYTVVVGESVNTTGTIAQGELHAVAEFIPSMYAKLIQIDLVTVPLTGSVTG